MRQQVPAESPQKSGNASPAEGKENKKSRRRLSRWVRIPLRVLGILLLIVVLIPVLLYIPPVQTALKDMATHIVRDKTGMDIKIERFRLKFPVDVSLQGVSVVEAGGDTMVNAREVIADVRLLPLLRLDVQINRLLLEDGYYRFLSPDSSMLIKIRAGHLEVDDRSSMEIAKSRILLNSGRLSDADISLYMYVWRQKPTPADTTSTPFYIAVNSLEADRVRFAMSMLPTIDTLTLQTDRLTLREGVIDLGKNDIRAKLMTLHGGDARYITPTPEYVAAHPAPLPDTTAVATPPMTIRADSVSLDGFGAIYAVRDARPLPGFDANYIEVRDVGIGLRNFYNQAASLRLPLTRLAATERSGLKIVEGDGLVALTEEGLSLDALSLRTLYSEASVTADLPFALMELKPSAPVNARLDASIGMADVDAFMPALKEYTRALPRQPLNALLLAEGRLDDVEVKALDLAIPTVFSLRARGGVRNALDLKSMVASLELDGEVASPSVVEKLAGPLPFELPPMKLKGSLGADRQTYTADLGLHTPQGGMLADGKVSLTSEAYNLDLDVDGLNVAHFMPDLGVGTLTAALHATGAGFNPVSPRAHTDIDARIESVTYMGKLLTGITLDGTLAGGRYSVDIDSPNEDLNLNAQVAGTLAEDDYCAEGMLRVYNADLQAFGLTKTECRGSVDMDFDITARPGRWLYDADLSVHSVEWHMEDYDIDLPQGVQARLIAESDEVYCNLTARGADVEFESATGLEPLMAGLTKAMNVASRQVEERNLDMEELQGLLPPFTLAARASGRGILSDFLTPSGLTLDTMSMSMANDTLIRANIQALGLASGTMTLDTISFDMKERGKLADYRFHMGNRPGTMDEFAKVDINGYFGSNRLSAFVTQKNLAGQTGYRVGFTAAVVDSTATFHFTPLKSTIAYMPWTFNDDNHVDYTFTNRKVHANLKASSRESSLLLMTEDAADGDGEDLHLNISNIQIEDFLRMSVLAPPVKATLDGDVRVHYDGKTLSGKGSISVDDFIYDKMMVGDFDLGLNAGVDLKGQSVIDADLGINGDTAMSLHTLLSQRDGALEPEEISLRLTRLPLKVANAFLGKDVASLSGMLNGDMKVTGSPASPLLNGSISVDSVSVFLPIMGGRLSFESEPLTVADNIISLNQFNIYGANRNPLSVKGTIDARNFGDMAFDINASAQNFMLINNDRRAKSDLYGKILLNLNATAQGPLRRFDVNATLNVLGGTNATYNVEMGSGSALVSTDEGVVKFVNFADTTQMMKRDTIPSMSAMRLHATATITPGAAITVNLGNEGHARLHPSGSVNAFRNYMGDMTLNGQLFLGEGSVKYKLPILGEKEFSFNPQSYVLFNGDMMNPVLSIKATDLIKASVVNSSGNSSLVNFLVGLDVSQTLSNPKVVFDLSTNDDLSLQNELQSMTADQRSTQAMNLLMTGMYSGAGLKTNSGNIADNMLYGFLESQLNSWAAKTVRGVDLSFGINNYGKSVDGVNTNTMSYSYQVSKSLFDNRFKIVVGGNYSTDASADENFAQNLISDISFEYTLKQTNSLTMLVRLFRHVGFESVLEGEVTETGVGFTMRRRLGDLRRLFSVRWGKKKTPAVQIPPASDSGQPADSAGRSDAVIREVREEMRQQADTVRPDGAGKGGEL